MDQKVSKHVQSNLNLLFLSGDGKIHAMVCTYVEGHYELNYNLTIYLISHVSLVFGRRHVEWRSTVNGHAVNRGLTACEDMTNSGTHTAQPIS